MNISFELKLSEDEASRLASAIGCAEADLEKSLPPYARAAMREYVTMIAGSGMPGRIGDLQELRLLMIIQEVFDGRAPGDLVVSRLLHVTPTPSAGLVRSVFAKYDFEMKSAKRQSLKEAIEKATKRRSTRVRRRVREGHPSISTETISIGKRVL